MKIDTSRSTSGVRSTKSLKSNQKTSSFAQVFETEGTGKAEATLPLTQIRTLNDILSIQEKPSSPREQGEKMLTTLEQLHTQMVLGQDSAQNLKEMTKVLQDKKQVCHDPKLHSLLNQIEQRIAVELAKRGQV